MTESRCAEYVALKSFIASIADGEYEVSEDCRTRAALLLHEYPRLTHYVPPVVAVEVCEEPE